MIIENFEELSTSEERRVVLEIVNAGIESVLPKNVIKNSVRCEGDKIFINNDEYDLLDRKIYVIGAGKASGAMAEALEKLLGDKIEYGVVNHKGGDFKTDKIKLNVAGHPIPTLEGMEGMKEMLSIKDKLSPNDIVICLVSGGGSALMPYPVDGIGFEDKQKTSELLVNSGAKIQEINIVRKHISKVKGGRLAEYFSPNLVISLIISDVVGDELQSIASGPTTYDSTTFQEAYTILKNYDILDKVPASVRGYIRKGMEGLVKETPKKMPPNSRLYLIGSNSIALRSMGEKATELKIPFEILTNAEERETSEAAMEWASLISSKTKKPFLYMLGGETRTKPPSNKGRGGRNMHYVVRSMSELRDSEFYWTLASVGTDGSDFLKDIAGGIADKGSLKQAVDKNLDVDYYLERYDSYNLLKQINGIAQTGDTGTNVGDIAVYLIN